MKKNRKNGLLLRGSQRILTTQRLSGVLSLAFLLFAGASVGSPRTGYGNGSVLPSGFQKQITNSKTTQGLKEPESGSFVASQQSKVVVKGKVTAKDGSPLPGVTVSVKGTTNGTVTDADGNYQLTISRSVNALLFSYVGMKTQLVAISGQSVINVSLSANAQDINEVVVVGYGTQKKVNLTGAVSQVTEKELKDRPVSNISQMLEGAVPNLNITFSTGQPGATGNLNIRGTTSINGGSPLVLIDGITGSLDRLNPQDVESISVLKDAAASAIYGARGAFGVILVTTKTAKEGKMKVSYGSNFGWSSPTVSTDFITTGYDAAELVDMAFKRSNGNSYTRYTDEDYNELKARRYDKTENSQRPWIVVKNVNGKDIYNYYGNYDWWNTVFNNTQPSMTHNMSVSGGNSKMDYYLSGSFYQRDGLMRLNRDKYDQYTFRSKIGAQVCSWLKVTNNTEYFDSRYRYPGGDGNSNFNWKMEVHALPCYAPVNPDGSATYNTGKNSYSIGNGMYANLLHGVSGGKKGIHEFTTTTGFVADLLKGWNVMGDYTFTTYMTDDWSRQAIATYSIQPGVIQPVPNFNTDYLKKNIGYDPMQVLNLYTNFNHDFGKHHFSAMGGMNYEQKHHNGLGGQRNNLLSESLNDLDLATGKNVYATGDQYQYTLFGLFFRTNYDYAGKYLLEVNGRYDGTSRFARGNRYGFFPSVSAGWRISEEPFFSFAKNTFDNLKLRASYGTLGNQLPSGSNYYPYISTMPAYNSSYLVNGQQLVYVSSPAPVATNLTWEKATTLNGGLDADFLRNRLGLNLDAYIRKTTNMLVPGETLPAVYGAASPTQNAGNLRTQGFELSVSWKDQFALADKPFHYSASVTLSDYTAKITKYNNPNKLLNNYYSGQRLGQLWGYSVDGYFKTDEEAQSYKVNQRLVNSTIISSPGDWGKLHAGDMKFIDLNGDGVISPGQNTLADHGDLKVVGNSLPRYQFGIKMGADWNGFDLSAFFQGVGKRNWYPGGDAEEFWGPYSSPYASFIPKDFAGKVWTPENPNAYFPLLRGYVARNSNNELYNVNDRYLQNLAYIRLKSLVVGYTIPAVITKRIGIQNCRFYASGENLFTWTKLKTDYIDPEQIDGENNGKTYLLSKTLSFGLDLTF